MYPLVPVAADSAAAQGPDVGATPTRAPETVDIRNAEIEVSQEPLTFRVAPTTLTYDLILKIKGLLKINKIA